MPTLGQLRGSNRPDDITASSGRRRRAIRESQAFPHPDELAPVTVADVCAALAPASWRRDETAAGHACELCAVVYAPAGPVSVATMLDHLEYDCPLSPIGRRLGRLAPSESELRVLDGNR